MVFPAPQVDGFENKAGIVHKRGQFQVSKFLIKNTIGLPLSSERNKIPFQNHPFS